MYGENASASKQKEANSKVKQMEARAESVNDASTHRLHTFSGSRSNDRMRGVVLSV